MAMNNAQPMPVVTPATYRCITRITTEDLAEILSECEFDSECPPTLDCVPIDGIAVFTDCECSESNFELILAHIERAPAHTVLELIHSQSIIKRFDGIWVSVFHGFGCGLDLKGCHDDL